MSRASFKVEIGDGEAGIALKRASDFLEAMKYQKTESETQGAFLFKKGSGWPVVPKYIERSAIVKKDGKTRLKCEGYIPVVILHETFKIGEFPFTDKPTLTINVIRKEGYRDLIALKEHIGGYYNCSSVKTAD